MPDIHEVRARADALVGKRCFRDYTRDKVDKNNFVRTIYSFEVKEIGVDELWFVVRGSGFMHNMVRIMCGRVLGIDKTLPAHGLVLESVEY